MCCTCPGRRKRKIAPGALRWHWRVLQRPSELCEDGGYESPSRWTTTSLVICLRCLKRWRTKARYADQLRDATQEELQRITAGEPMVGKKDETAANDVPLDVAGPAEARRHHVDYKMLAAGG